MITHALMALAPVLGLAAYCFSHLVACRAGRLYVRLSSLTCRSRQAGKPDVPKHSPYFPLVIGCGCGLAATAAISLAALLWLHVTLANGLALAAVNLVAYLALAFGYFNFVNLNIASLRIRMIQELAESDGQLPVERLTGLYNTETVIEVRIDRLTRGGHLVERDGRYYSGKRRFLVVARIFDFLRWAILGQRTHNAPRDGAETLNQQVCESPPDESTYIHDKARHAERDEYVEPVTQLAP
jgi:hypothetical protein